MHNCSMQEKELTNAEAHELVNEAAFTYTSSVSNCPQNNLQKICRCGLLFHLLQRDEDGYSVLVLDDVVVNANPGTIIN